MCNIGGCEKQDSGFCIICPENGRTEPIQKLYARLGHIESMIDDWEYKRLDIDNTTARVKLCRSKLESLEVQRDDLRLEIRGMGGLV